MRNQYTALIQQRGKWWIGWVEEIPGVNSQGETRDELIENLRSALKEGNYISMYQRPCCISYPG